MTATLLTRRATLTSKNSVDVERRTAEAVLCTSAAIRRHGERPDGSYGPWLEQLSLDAVRVDHGTLPLLLDHDHGRAASRIGVAENIRREADRLIATLRFSSREDVTPLLHDLAEGVDIGALSVGYSVRTWERAR